VLSICLKGEAINVVCLLIQNPLIYRISSAAPVQAIGHSTLLSDSLSHKPAGSVLVQFGLGELLCSQRAQTRVRCSPFGLETSDPSLEGAILSISGFLARLSTIVPIEDKRCMAGASTHHLQAARRTTDSPTSSQGPRLLSSSACGASWQADASWYASASARASSWHHGAAHIADA
jgi:hypothetical protein